MDEKQSVEICDLEQKLTFSAKNTERNSDRDEGIIKKVFEDSPVGIYIVQDNKFKFSNPAFQKTTGYQEKELIDMDVRTLIFPEDRARVRESARSMLKNGAAESYKYRGVSKSGEIRWILETVTSIIYNGRRSVLGWFVDNTQLENLERALMNSEAQKQAILDGITTSLVFFDTNLKILWVNHAAADIMNSNPGMMIGHSCDKICRDLQTQCDQCPVQETLKTRKTDELVIYSPDGKVWDTKAEPVFDENRELIGVLKISHDITEKQRMEEQLRQAQKFESLGTLAGGVAHDFNNIIGIIMNYAHLINLSLSGSDEKMKKNINHILTACRSAKDLVDQFHTFTLQGPVEKKPVNVRTVLENVIQIFKGTLPDTIRLSHDISDADVNILGDETQIQQILLNLFTNAAQAMTEGGVLEVSLKHLAVNAGNALVKSGLEPGKYVDLCISDTGCGMNEDVASRIFDPYFTTKKKKMGTGLGLAVVRGIVKNHGGRVRVISKTGEGSSFHVYLPVVGP